MYLKLVLFAIAVSLFQWCCCSSTDPISAQPPLVRPSTKSCKVSIIDIVNCTSWDQVTSQKFILPTTCIRPWSKIILDVDASEQGTQFDRFGALWMGNVEILRTTTPEPTSQGNLLNVANSFFVLLFYQFCTNLMLYFQG